MKLSSPTSAYTRLTSCRGGVSRLAAILLALIAILTVLAAGPAWKIFRYRSEKTGCDQALKSATDGLIIEYLSRWDSGSVETARDSLDEILPERPDICPSGGTVYLIRGEHGIFEPVCGLHESDRKLRVRLNASHALELLRDKLVSERWSLPQEPDDIIVQVNSRDLDCIRVTEEPDIHRGTNTTQGYEGVVAYYGIAGEGAFADVPAELAEPGEICFFLYADEYHCAIWRATGGWTGDAYQD